MLFSEMFGEVPKGHLAQQFKRSWWLQVEGQACIPVKIVALARDRIRKRVSMAEIEAMTCLEWLNNSATSADYEDCPLSYSELAHWKVLYS